jgi:Tfp pilus assembly protein PilF
MVHSNRLEAESYLQNALKLDPNLALAHAALGMLRFRQNKLAEARLSLERAVAANYENYLIHYYYALVLARPNDDEVHLGSGFSGETAQKIRTELKKAIALRPDFPESYNLLAFINLVTNTDVDESIKMLRQALVTSPGRIDFIYLLGQLYMNKDDYRSARPLLEQVATSDAEERVRDHSKRLIETITKIEEQRTKSFRSKRDGLSGRIGAQPSRGREVDDLPPEDDLTPPTLDDVLRVPEPGERQLQGTLLHVECHSNGLVFVIKTASGLLRLKSADFNKVELTTFDTRVRGTLTCGIVKPQNSVVVCYVPEKDRKASTDGILRSIQFVPADFHLTPAA